MGNLITEHMGIWSAAQAQKRSVGRGGGKNGNGQSAYGIKKLRELILELAVRGKLVPQDPKSEPASVLLEKITKEKVRLIKEGKIKKEKPLPEVGEDEKPFELPAGWEWARIGDVGHDWGQKKPDNNFTYIEVSGIDNLVGIVKSANELAAAEAPSRARKIVKVGTVIYSTVRPYLQNTCVIDQEYSPEPIASTAFAIFHPLQKMPGKFFTLYLRSPVFVNYVETVQTGIAYPAINDKQFFGGLVPIPPLAEQHRIVTKVNELMALCDQLEQQQTDSNATHQTLVETLLATLTNAADQRECAEAWQRIANHFDTLFTTEQSIDHLKQTILQLAVMGKLVPQGPNDEPASILLKKIAKEKTRLIKEGKIKKQKPLPEIREVEKPFELPVGWAWVRIGDATIFTEYGMSEKTFDGIKGISVLKMGDIQDGKVILGGQKLVPENAVGLPSLYLKKWDLLYNRTNSAELVGKTGIYVGPDDAYTFASYLVRIRCSEKCVHPMYLNLTMNTSSFRATQIEPHLKQQCGQANVNATTMRNMIVPVPPLAEQHRIVKKVDELMALCDITKARLKDAQSTQTQMAEAIVEQAVT